MTSEHWGAGGRMLVCLYTVALLSVVIALPGRAHSATLQDNVFSLIYFQFQDDPRYAAKRSYAGLKLNEPRRPLAGVQLALKEAKVIGRSLGVRFELIELSVSKDSDYLTALEQSLASTGSVAIIADIPKNQLIALAAQFRHSNVLLFNAHLPDDDLRAALCAQKLFHTIPSYTMLTDSLAQFLKARDWTAILSLQGPLPEDAQLTLAMEGSARKFGLKIVGRKHFILSNNPRDRDQSNIPTLTSRPKHDVVFVADAYGEFARYVPYQTYAPKLVVGSEGLMSAAWHWTWERHGAPQLNQRFERLAQSQLSSEEWAGWAAAKSLIAALAIKTSKVEDRKTEDRHDFESLYHRLSSEQLTLDLYKGAPGNFRPWNNQLRQPLLLHTHSAVIQRTPMAGFMHHRNTLDTLGSDEAESGCRW